MKKIDYKVILPYLVAVLVFLVVTLAYFSPLLEGKRIRQSDTMQYMGASKELNDYREKTGEEALWTNSMFGGMPAYLISVKTKGNIIKHLNIPLGFRLGVPARYILMCLIGFYILLLAFKVDPWLSIVGALAFSFSTYFFIIGAVGHNSKLHAVAFMAPVIAGIILSFRGKILLGALVTGIFFSLQLSAGHPQISYYTLIIILIYGIVQFIYLIRDKRIIEFFKIVGILAIAGILAVGTNVTRLWFTYDYSKESIRGKSELTSNQEDKTAGLDKTYILNDYSYGIAETFNLLIPNFMGGASRGLTVDSELFKVMRQNNVPNAKQIVEQNPLAYWGGQRSTAGPVYIGSIVVFLFVLGLFLVKGPVKWWLLSVSILAILLAWGKNFLFLSNIFIDYFPVYNKFRTVSMILVIAEFAMPLLGILAVQKIIEEGLTKKEFLGAIKKALIIVGGITLFFSLLPGALFDFSGGFDEQLSAAGWPDFFMDALREDRKHLLQADAFRSFIFIVLAGILIIVLYYKKIGKNIFYVGLAALFLLDLWTINRRYLNNDNFVTREQQQNPFVANKADEQILEDPDPDFRVLDLTTDVFNSTKPSFFHKSIGGYHGAKMKRYNELISYQIAPEIQQIQNTFQQENLTMEILNNMMSDLDVLNMLNTKYIIYNGSVPPLFNDYALGNAWFVDTFRIVENADEELAALTDINPEALAIIDKRFENQLSGFTPVYDSSASISLLEYQPNYLSYVSESSSEQLAVFSEIYYPRDWKVYIDSRLVTHFRANYVLRAMVIPEGEHIIEFRFEPKTFYTSENISLACSAILLLLFIGIVFREVRKKNQDQE